MCTSVIGQVVGIDGGAGIASVDVDGRCVEVSLVVLALEDRLPVPGDWLHVHTGFAVEVLDEDEALAWRSTLRAVHGEGHGRDGDPASDVGCSFDGDQGHDGGHGPWPPATGGAR